MEDHSSEISVLPAPDGPFIHPRAAESTTPARDYRGAKLRQILDRFWIDIGTDEELDDGPDRLPPVTAFTVTMRARKCGNPVSWKQEVPGRVLQRLSLDHVSSRAGEWWIHRVAPFPAPGDPRDILAGPGASRRLQATHGDPDGDRRLPAHGLPHSPRFTGATSSSTSSRPRASRPCPIGFPHRGVRFRVNRRRVERVRRGVVAQGG